MHKVIGKYPILWDLGSFSVKKILFWNMLKDIANSFRPIHTCNFNADQIFLYWYFHCNRKILRLTIGILFFIDNVIFCRYCFVFFLLKVFPSMVSAFGLPVVFWIHSFICLCGTVFAYIFLPETKVKVLVVDDVP